VNWSTDEATYVAGRDPLNFSRFNFMAFVEVDEDDGTKEYKDTFFLLDSICKSFCVRCFFSEGAWHIVSVNNYDNWKSPNTNFFRKYVNSSSVNPSTSGNTSKTLAEGTTIKRFGASFGMLPIIKEVRAKYSNLTPYDMPQITYNNNSDTSTDYEFNSNEIPIWNGFSYNNVNYTGSNYDFNRASNDALIIDLGNVAAITGSGILINRDFLFKTTQVLNFTDVGGQNDAIKAKLALRFRLVGSSDTYYWPLSANNDTWFTSNIFPITQEIGPALSWNDFEFGNNFININVQTSELPESGQLFFEAFAKCFYNNYAGVPVGTNAIEITESTTTADPTKILVYSPPEFNEEQGFKYTLNNEVITDKFFISINSPSGTAITDGVKLELDDNLFGTGPTSGAVGRLETYNYTTSAFDDGTNSTWKAFGSGSGVEFTQLQVNQVLKGQMQGAKIFNGSLKITDKTNQYHFINGIEIDSTMYVPYQVTYNANEEVWSGVWYEIDLSTDTQTVASGFISGLGASNNFEIAI